MGRIQNPHFPDIYPTWRHFLLWKLGFYDEPSLQTKAPSSFVYPVEIEPFVRDDPYGCWIGHSTFLIETNGLHFLTDPVWNSYCSPIPLKVLRRRAPPAIPLDLLPSIDCVLISHNHYDHLDAKTVMALHLQFPHLQWIVPKNLSRWFAKRGIVNTIELNWWQQFSHPGYTVTAVPAQHFSGRTLWDKNRTGWNGYLVETGGKKFYFAGDTGYNPFHFKEIGAYAGSIDLSLIPIGVYAPRRFMAPVHIHPDEAVQIHEDVRSRQSIGMHWNTFCLSEEEPNRPPYDLFLAMQEKKLPLSSFIPIEIGYFFNW